MAASMGQHIYYEAFSASKFGRNERKLRKIVGFMVIEKKGNRPANFECENFHYNIEKLNFQSFKNHKKDSNINRRPSTSSFLLGKFLATFIHTKTILINKIVANSS